MMRREITFTLPPGSPPRLLRSVLQKELCVSSALLAKLKRRPGAIRVCGEDCFVSRVLSPGEEAVIDVADPKDEIGENILPSPGDVAVVYEDPDLLVLDKAPLVPVHPSMGHFDDTLANFVRYRALGKGEDFVFRPVNRLDRGTSGLLIVAKHAYAHDRLSSQMKTGAFFREYLAVACGELKANEGEIDAPIARVPGSVLQREVSVEGKRAVTLYQTLGRRRGMTLLSLRLLTGRTHQIRVHLAHIGHPLVSDFLYGEETDLISRTPLHSARLCFLHPVSGESLEFFSPLPEDMKLLFYGE